MNHSSVCTDGRRTGREAPGPEDARLHRIQEENEQAGKTMNTNISPPTCITLFSRRCCAEKLPRVGQTRPNSPLMKLCDYVVCGEKRIYPRFHMLCQLICSVFKQTGVQRYKHSLVVDLKGASLSLGQSAKRALLKRIFDVTIPLVQAPYPLFCMGRAIY